MEFWRMSKLAYIFIKFPQNVLEPSVTAMLRFQAFTNSIIPNTVGVINGTHAEITYSDTERRVDY